ncbi:hypothetical protein KDM41_08325 [bacterium]|nr:hypothetical protein [bacterium]
MNRIPSRLVTAAGLALVLAAGGVRAAVPEVANGPTPRDGAETLPLEELWRVGGPDDEENLLGVVGGVLADDDGNVYLLDLQLVEVQVFDAEGTFTRSLGQRGDGPGELRFVVDALFMPDGSLGLVQPFPGKIVKVGLDGVPAGEVRPGGDPTNGGFFAVRSAASRGGEIVLSGTRIVRGEGTATMTHFVDHLGPEAVAGHPLLEKTNVRDFANRRVVESDEYFPHGNEWDLGPDGRVALVPERDAYRVAIFGADGAAQMAVTRRVAPLQRSAADKEEAKAGLMPWRRRGREQLTIEVEDTAPAIQRVRWGDDGRLWVLPARGTREQPAGVHSTWDVFTPDGVFERQVAFACDADGEQDAIFFPGGDLVVVVKQFKEALRAFQGRAGADDAEVDESTEPSPLEVVCYRLAPGVAAPRE